MEEMPQAVELAPQQSQPRRSSSAEDSGDTCRICRSEATLNQPLFHPCKCNGNIKHVHQNCLMEWLSYSQKKHCDLCKTTFRFSKIYDRSMPENVPWTLFGKQVVVHSLRAIGRWTLYSIVAIIWFFWLPWTSRQIWRALSWIADVSWLDIEELVAAVQEHGSHQSNTSSSFLSTAIANTTFTRHVATNVGLFAPVTILVFLDPHIIVRFLVRPMLQLAMSLAMQDEPIWEGALLLAIALMLRLPSLLSVFETSDLALRFPILNNAILDVLEGQVLCLTTLIAVMLGSVIDGQPLPNLPEEEQPENAPPPRPADEERRAARMYPATMPDAQPNAKGPSVLEGICRWLWQMDDVVMPETAGVESVANVDTQDLLAVPESDLHGTNNPAVFLYPAPQALPNTQSIVPQIALVDQNAIDAVEQADSDIGMHGKNDDRFSRMYIPSCFRVRVSAFIGLTWLFVAVMGLTFTVGPLLLGRGVIRRFEPSNPLNDLYALMIGVHLFGIAIFAAYWARTWYSQSAKKLASVLKSCQTAIPILCALMKRSASIAYLAVSLVFVTPMALSKLVELYINIPAFTHLIAGPADFENPRRDSLSSTTHNAGTQSVTHLLQTWVMGLIYVITLLRFASAPAYEDTRPAVAIKAIVRGGLLKPDVKLASRALILPTLFLCTILYGLPPLIARATIALYVKKLTHDDRARLYRYAYPVLLTVALSLYTIRKPLTRIKRWRIKIRDEVYLIGERLLNFPDQDDARSGRTTRSGSLKGKEKATTVSERKSTMDEKQ